MDDYDRLKRTFSEDKPEEEVKGNGLAARPRRSVAVARKPLIISEDEEDKGGDDESEEVSIAIDVEDNDEEFMV